MTMQDKKDMRKQMLALRNEMPAAAKLAYDQAICRHIIQLLRERNVKSVHTYLPMGSEADITPAIQYMLDCGIRVATPKALKGRTMENLMLTSLGELEDGIYGTKHPANAVAYEGPFDLFIVPGLAFDRDNFRLGYGSGYYDTFFNNHPGGYKMGIGYPFQLTEHVPTEAHDVRLDEVFCP